MLNEIKEHVYHRQEVTITSYVYLAFFFIVYRPRLNDIPVFDFSFSSLPVSCLNPGM